MPGHSTSSIPKAIPVELYCDTPFYTPQPCGEPLDLVQPNDEILRRTEAMCRQRPRFMSLPRAALDVVSRPAWAWEYLCGGGLPMLQSWQAYAPGGSNAHDVVRFFSERWLGNQTWRDLERVRALWPGKLVVKGLVHPDDAQAALQAGADAVMVSNHGGNKLDRMRASIDDLPGVVERLGGKGQVLFDGGIRRGSDIVMVAALGARFSFVGRATLYGLGACGLEGALRAIEILRSGVAYTMAMIGCKTVSDIGAGHVVAAA